MEKVSQGIHVPHLDLVFPLLRMRHAIHVVFGGSDLQPLTAGELSLVEEIMNRKFSIPLAKEAKTLLEGAASSSQKKKRKRPTLPDTRVVDDPMGYKKSKAEASAVPSASSAGTPPDAAPHDPSLAKSSGGQGQSRHLILA